MLVKRYYQFVGQGHCLDLCYSICSFKLKEIIIQTNKVWFLFPFYITWY